MRILVALGGNALLKRGEPMTAEVQREEHPDRGTGPRSGGRASPAGALPRQRPPGRSAGAPSGRVQGGRGVPPRRPRCPDGGDDRLPHRAGARQPPAARGPVRHDPHDDRGRLGRSGVRRPDEVRRTDLRRMRTPRRWRPRRDGCSSATATSFGASSPRRHRSGSSRFGPFAGCSSSDVLVICAGGGGIPTTWVAGKERTLGGVEAVIDKDLASELLAREVDADLFLMATDVDGVYDELGNTRAAAARAGHAGRAAQPALRRGVDGPQGRGRSSVRRGNREARRHRRAGGHRADRRGRAGTTVVPEQDERGSVMS